MRLNEITWQHGDTDKWDTMKINHAIASYKFSGLQNAIGIDPGRNWGCSVLQDGTLITYWGKIPRMKPQEAHNYICDFICGWFPIHYTATACCIEGAAFGATYGRELLEDYRLGMWNAFEAIGRVVSYVPPLTIRKTVFGRATIKGNEIWTSINPNGADSVPIALYAGGYQFKE